jgi:hypothetical protein
MAAMIFRVSVEGIVVFPFLILLGVLLHFIH